MISFILSIQEIADWRIACYFTGVILSLFILKFIFNLFSGYNLKEQLIEQDNKAVALSFSGFTLAILLIFHSLLTTPSSLNTNEQWLTDLLHTFAWAIGGGILLILSQLFNDLFILHRFSSTKELVRDNNYGVGAIQASTYLSIAIILSAILSSPAESTLIQDIGYSLLWFALSNISLMLFSYVYQWSTKYDLHKELEQDNPAVGIAFAGYIVSFGILLSYYVSNYDDWVGLLIWICGSIITLIILQKGLYLTLLKSLNPNKEIATDQNWGIALLEALLIIGLSLCVTGSFT